MSYIILLKKIIHTHEFIRGITASGYEAHIHSKTQN